mmetsp:Transcript_3316/g.7610  ORF Transcript_3316/g.7610 Transcript_3316/m.7610 type:complete len:251 (-) Transcript_3316:1862-2614(-)
MLSPISKLGPVRDNSLHPVGAAAPTASSPALSLQLDEIEEIEVDMVGGLIGLGYSAEGSSPWRDSQSRGNQGHNELAPAQGKAAAPWQQEMTTSRSPQVSSRAAAIPLEVISVGSDSDTSDSETLLPTHKQPNQPLPTMDWWQFRGPDGYLEGSSLSTLSFFTSAAGMTQTPVNPKAMALTAAMIESLDFRKNMWTLFSLRKTIAAAHQCDSCPSRKMNCGFEGEAPLCCTKECATSLKPSWSMYPEAVL